MATPQKLRCLVNKITDHGDHVYTVDLAPERPVPRFKPGQFLHLTLDDYDETFEFLPKPSKSSFLRKQESSLFKVLWIPAFAGMTKEGRFSKVSDGLANEFHNNERDGNR